MNLSWNELVCHGLGKKLPEKGLVVLVMIHLGPMRKKWVKDYGTGKIEKYIMENGIHGSRELFEIPEISMEMWCKAALRREFKSQWWWRAPEKRREKCYNVVNVSITRYSASTLPPQPIMGMPDELLKNDVHGLYETLDDSHPLIGWARAVERQWDDNWSRKRDAAWAEVLGSVSWLGTHAILRAKWYRDIHEGRYFLFFKMNEKLKIRVKNGVENIDCRRFSPMVQWGYTECSNERTPRSMGGRWRLREPARGVCDIMGFSSEAQCASDLLTIDGWGLNHSSSKEVMHIDDMFQ